MRRLLTPARAQVAATLLALLAAGIILLWVADLVGLDRAAGAKPPARDFVAFWAAARLALQGQGEALYNNSVIEAFERAHVSMAPGYYAFYYPPPFLLACLPLGLLPYVWSLLLFLAAQAALFWTTLRAILPRSWGLMPLLACPGFLLNALSGQNGGLTASCFGGALLLLDARPLLGGACLGALVYKPQMALAVPVALLAARRIRAALAAGGTAAALCLASLLALGTGPWRGFLSNAGAARGDLERLSVKWPMMQSFYADIRLGGGGLALGYGGQAVLALAALALLAHLSWRRAGAGPEAAALAATALLVTPFLYDYDLVVLAVPLAWLARRSERAGIGIVAGALMLVLYLLPLDNVAVRAGLGMPLAPPLIFCLLVLIWREGLRDAQRPVPA